MNMRVISFILDKLHFSWNSSFLFNFMNTHLWPTVGFGSIYQFQSEVYDLIQLFHEALKRHCFGVAFLLKK